MGFKIAILVIVFVLDFLMGLLIFLKDKKNKLNFSFLLLSLTSSAWSLGMALYYFYSPDRVAVLAWSKILYLAGGVTAFAFLKFTLDFLEINLKKRYLGLLLSPCLIIFILLYFFPEPLIKNVLISTGNIRLILSSSWWFYYAYFFAYFTVSLYLLAVNIKYSAGIKKSRISYVFWGSFIPCLAASVVNMFLPLSGNFRFAWLGPAFLLFLLGNIFYAIVKYRLLDIKFALRRSIVYGVSLLAIVIPVILAKYLILRYYYNVEEARLDLFDFLALASGAIIFPEIRNHFFRLANKYFFSSLYDSKKVIARLSENLSSTIEASKIYNFISDALINAFHVKALAILVYSHKTNTFLVKHNFGFSFKQGRIVADKKIINGYIAKNRIVIIDELKDLAYSDYHSFIDQMKGLGIEIVVPFNLKSKVTGVIVLSEKESGDIYNHEDLEILRVFGSQMAISLENAFLYEKTKNFNVKLTEKIEEATNNLKSANEELKKLDEAKSEFISIASHQLRTPLTVIKGYVSMMLEGNFGELSPVEKESLARVYESSERLIHLVEDLLNISRIESGKMQFNFESAQIEPMMDSVITELANSAKNKKLDLIYNKPASLLPPIKIDQDKLRQVVMNIIDNSIKYTKQGNVKVTLEELGDNLRVVVSDTGMGITADDLPNLFKKFSRGTGTSLIHTEGTGLGLYVGRMIIEAHGGRIWAESEGEGRGSRFIFELPILK